MNKKVFKFKNSLKKCLGALFFVTTIYASIAFCVYLGEGRTIKIERGEVLSYNAEKANDVVYLSDIPYKKAQVGWGTLGLDKTNSNTFNISYFYTPNIITPTPKIIARHISSYYSFNQIHTLTYRI